MFANDWAEAHAKEQIELIKTLCAIPAFSGLEAERAAFICRWLHEAGATDAFNDGAGNVCLPIGDADAPGLHVYMAHIDTVFPPETPLPIVQTEDRLCCPGVGDDTTNVAALMLYAREIVRQGLTPRQPVMFVFNTGEEGLGNLRGVREICRRHSGSMAQLISFDGGYTHVVDRAVGSERYEVTVRTEGGHSYAAFGNSNAIHQASEIIHALYLIRVPHKDGARTTYNVGTIAGGTSVNTIAQDVTFTCEYRSDDRECLDAMRRMFMGVFDGFRALGWQIDVRLIGERPCMSMKDTAAHERLLTSCEDAIEAVTGRRPSRGPSSTDANIPLSLGIPATAFGLYLGEKAHTREEWIDLTSLLPGLKIGIKVLENVF